MLADVRELELSLTFATKVSDNSDCCSSVSDNLSEIR